MIFFVFIPIAAFLIVLYDSESYDSESFLDGLFAGFLGLIVAVVLASIVGLFVYTDYRVDPYMTKPLVSLADGAGLEGHFFLGSGSVEDRPVFTWYEKSADNSYVRKHADADYSVIHYLTSDRPPYLVISRKVPTPSGFFQKWGLQTNTVDDYDRQYDFYVPRNSIVQTYKLDNK